MSQKYELQAARIEAVLNAHKVPARVWQATVTPRFVRFDVTTALGTRINKVSNLAEELAFSLGAQAARVYREGGVLHVEVPRDAPRTVTLLNLCAKLSNVPPNCAVLGVDEGGAPLLLRLDSPDVAHVLLAGTTGSGKTALLRTLLLSLAMHNHAGRLQIVLIDPKGRGLAGLADLPHVWRPRTHGPPPTRSWPVWRRRPACSTCWWPKWCAAMPPDTTCPCSSWRSTSWPTCSRPAASRWARR